MIRIRLCLLSIVVTWCSARKALTEIPGPDSEELISRNPELSAFTRQPIWTQMKIAAAAGYAVGYTEGYTEGYSDNAEKNFHSYFFCFLTKAKPILEVYQEFTKLSTDDTIEVPEKIRQMNISRDLWMYKRYSKAAHGKSTTVISESDGEDKLTKYFRIWYSWTVPEMNRPEFFVTNLMPALKFYYQKYRSRYQDETDLHKVFAANMARFYLMFCQVFEGDLLTSITDYIAKHPDCHYHEALLYYIPLWYLDAEQLDLLEILLHEVLKLKKMSPVEIGRLYIRNGDGDLVILPYIYSNQCGREPIFKTTPWPQL